jgi:hypothetical protein
VTKNQKPKKHLKKKVAKSKRAIVGVLKSDLPNIPNPGTIAKLDDWNCVVSEEGIEEESFAYRIPLRTP